jgi:NDP-sugar pyrophosphorylase family protein
MGDMTRVVPKPMLLLAGKPIIEHIISELPEKINEAIIVVSPTTKAQFEDYFSSSASVLARSLKISYAIQNDDLNGTYGALYSAKDLLKDKFLVLNGDDLIDRDSLNKMVKEDLAMGFTLQIPPAPNYFIFRTTDDGFIKDMVRPSAKELESPQLIASGTYMLNTNIWKLEPFHIKGTEYGLPQTLQPILNKFKAITLKQWIKINTPKDLQLAEEELSKAS